MNSNLLISKLQNKEYDDVLLDYYVDSSLIDYQRERYIATIRQFEKLYGNKDVMIISVPGRSEVGGNHTDHQHGKVLACSINLDIIAVVAKSNNLDIVSDNRKVYGLKLSDLLLTEKEKHTTKALVKGVLRKLKDDGYEVGGFECYMTSDVLVGSGMSSSAAFEVMIGNIVSALYNQNAIDPIEIAKVSQYSENVYFGKPSGLMDQMACSVGNLIWIDFKDNENPVVKRIDIDFSSFNYSLCIVDTKGSHAKLNEDYAAIPEEMHKVADYFHKQYVSELSIDKIIENIPEIRKTVSDRAILRSLHVLYENQRVDNEANALLANDFPAFLANVKESGNSSYKYLQNVFSCHDYENQAVSLGLMLSENFLKENGVCRVHGGGFAGTIQAFVKNDFVQQYRQNIEAIFGTGSCHILKVRKYGGRVILN